MKRDQRLVKLSWDHHHGLVFALRIEREVTHASSEDLATLYSDLLAFWSAGLLPHFRTEDECLLARLIRHIPPHHELVRRTQEEHLRIEALVTTMRDTQDLEVRRHAIRQFGALLRDHIRWEEATLFDDTQRTLRDDELTNLAADIEQRLSNITPAPLGTRSSNLGTPARD